MSYTGSPEHGRTMTVEELLRLLATRKYRGAVTFHFDNGRPLVAEYGRPNQVELIQKLYGAAAASAAANGARKPTDVEPEGLELVRAGAPPAGQD